MKTAQGSALEKKGHLIHKRAFTEAEAATYISMSRSFLRQSPMNGNRENRTPGPRWRRMGARSVRYMIEELDAWLDQFPTMSPAPVAGGDL